MCILRHASNRLKKLYKTISYSSLKLADRSISDMDMKTAGTVRILKLFENEYINVEFTGIELCLLVEKYQ